jgi:hypothetical protein
MTIRSYEYYDTPNLRQGRWIHPPKRTWWPFALLVIGCVLGTLLQC